MAKQTINNNDKGSIVRGKINDNFTENYNDIATLKAQTYLNLIGDYNASTNAPDISTTTMKPGEARRVTVAGTQFTLDLQIGDLIVRQKDDSGYFKIDNTQQTEIDDLNSSTTRTYSSDKINTELNKKINIADVVDNLTSTDTNKPLSAKQGKTLKDSLDLKANDSAVVHNTTDETITGVKTFSSFPITPSSAPTTDYQIANKKYVDDQLTNENLWDRSGTDVFAHNVNDNIDLKDGGLKDTNATTAIKLADASNTSLNTTNKTLIGGLNEIYNNISANYLTRTQIDQAMAHYESLFVDPTNGNDITGTGTRTKPFKTIQAAINSFTAGSPHVIYVNGSTTADITFRAGDQSMMIIFDAKTQHSGTITLVNDNTSIYFVANSSRTIITGTVNDGSKGNIYWCGIYKSGIYNKTGGASDYNVAGYVEFDFASNVDGLILNLTGNSMVRILGIGAMGGLSQSNGMFIGQFKGSIATPTITGGINPLLGQPICLLQGEIQLIKNGSNKSLLCSASYGLVYLAGISTLQLDFTTFGQIDFTGSGVNCFCQVWTHSQLAASGDVFPATGALLQNSALYLNASRTATNYTVAVGKTSAKDHFDGIDTAIGNKVTKNVNITGATKTKITYDTKGLVTGGADATTADITDSTDKRYITEIEKGKLSTLLPTSITKEVTGFYDYNSPYNDTIDISYNSTNRTITLTGDFSLYYLGNEVIARTSSWTSPAHASSPTTPLFLKYDGSSFVWSSTPWAFYEGQIAYVNYSSGGVFRFAIRETHALMQWQTHKELHETNGTYKNSGGSLSNYILNSTTASDRRPDVSSTIVSDEDLRSTISQNTSKLYTQLYLSGANGDPVFIENASDIIPLLANQPYYNQFTAGNWQQTLLSNNQYTCVWHIAIPTTSDIQSLKYRYIYLQGQSVGTLAEQQSLQPNNLSLSTLIGVATEFVFVNKIILRYTSGNWQFVQVDVVQGTRNLQTNSPAGNYLSSVATDSTLTGNGSSSSPLGVNVLDASKITSGVLDISRIPVGAVPTLKIVADQAARFALTTSDVQNGDTVKQTDTDVMYYVKDQTNLSNTNGYEVYKSAVDWSSVSGKPSDIFYKNTDTAANIVNTPAGNIAATNVQAAINELDTEKEAKSNKTTSFQVNPDDTHYPSEKLVKDQLDLKLDKDLSSLTEKTTLNDNDLFVIADSSSSYALKKAKKSNVGGGGSGSLKTKQFLSVVNGTTVTVPNATAILNIAQIANSSSPTSSINYDNPVDYTLSNSNIVSVAGGSASLKPTASIMQSWSTKKTSPAPYDGIRPHHFFIDDDNYLVIGGYNGTSLLSTVAKYTLSSNANTSMGGFAIACSLGASFEYNGYGYIAYPITSTSYTGPNIIKRFLLSNPSSSTDYLTSSYARFGAKAAVDKVNGFAYISPGKNSVSGADNSKTIDKIEIINLNTDQIVATLTPSITFADPGNEYGGICSFAAFCNGSFYYSNQSNGSKIIKFTPNSLTNPTGGTYDVLDLSSLSVGWGNGGNQIELACFAYENKIHILRTSYRLEIDTTVAYNISAVTKILANQAPAYTIYDDTQKGHKAFINSVGKVLIFEYFYDSGAILLYDSGIAYPINSLGYVTSTLNSGIDLSISNAESGATISWAGESKPTNTTLNYLWSYDLTNWYYYNGTAWAVTAAPTLETDAKASSIYTNAVMASFINQAISNGATKLHLRAFFKSTSNSVTSSLNYVTLTFRSTNINITNTFIAGTDWTVNESNINSNALDAARSIPVVKNKAGTHDILVSYI